MAYSVKYYKNIDIAESGITVRLEILQRDHRGGAREIGTLQGISLDIQGGTNDVYTPIIKTSLSVSMADMNHLTTSTKKCGRWEEFYTPDSTLYLMRIKVDNEIVWSGFLTPDSWEEDLEFGGSINITARDMLGALQDEDFNMSGKVKIRDLITKSIEVSKANMAVTIMEDDMLFNTNGMSILDAEISADTYADKDWYTALTSSIEALGLVMRWNGHNAFVVTSLRHLCDIFDTEKVVRFINSTGHRVLDPAVKRIVDEFEVETIDYEPYELDEATLVPNISDFIQDVNIKIPNGYITHPVDNIRHYTIGGSPTEGYLPGTDNGPFAIPPYPFVDQIKKSEKAIYVLPDIRNRTSLEHDSLSSFKYVDKSLSFPLKLVVEQYGDILTSDNEWMYPAPNMRAGSVEVHIEATFNGVRKVYAYLGWMDKAAYSDYFSTRQFNNGRMEIDLQPYTQAATTYIGSDVEITFRNFRTDGYIEWNNYPVDEFDDNYPAEGLWMPIRIGVEQVSDKDYDEKYKTTTIYDEKYNVDINRSPAIGSADTSIPAWLASNVLSYSVLAAVNKWKWKNSSETFPLAVMVHRQLLCYYGATASIITGDAILNDTNYLVSLSKYAYASRHLILNGGTFLFTEGILSGSQLREYYRYEDIWEDGVIPGTDWDVIEGEDESGGSTTPVMPIALTVSPESVLIESTLPADGIITITADSRDEYQITSSATWLTTSASSGRGNMELHYYVSGMLKDSVNAAMMRTATLTIGKKVVRFTQTNEVTSKHPILEDSNEIDAPGIGDIGDHEPVV